MIVFRKELHVTREPAQIRESINKMEIQKKICISRYDKMAVNIGFCAYMRMYREAEKLIEI